MPKVPKQVFCPHCKLEVAPGPEAETAHMREQHPEIVERRMELAGFRRGEDGEWIDRLTEGIRDAD